MARVLPDLQESDCVCVLRWVCKDDCTVHILSETSIQITSWHRPMTVLSSLILLRFIFMNLFLELVILTCGENTIVQKGGK